MGSVSAWTLIWAATQPVLKVVLLCAVGAVCARKGILDYKGRKVLSSLSYLVFIPALNFISLGSSLTPSRLLHWWPLFVNVFLGHAMGGALGYVLVKVMRHDAWFKRHIIAAVMFGNTGNLPLVIVSTLARTSAEILGGVDPRQAEDLAVSYIIVGLVVSIIAVPVIGYRLLAKHPDDPPGPSNLDKTLSDGDNKPGSDGAAAITATAGTTMTATAATAPVDEEKVSLLQGTAPSSTGPGFAPQTMADRDQAGSGTELQPVGRVPLGYTGAVPEGSVAVLVSEPSLALQDDVRPGQPYGNGREGEGFVGEVRGGRSLEAHPLLGPSSAGFGASEPSHGSREGRGPTASSIAAADAADAGVATGSSIATADAADAGGATDSRSGSEGGGGRCAASDIAAQHSRSGNVTYTASGKDGIVGSGRSTSSLNRRRNGAGGGAAGGRGAEGVTAQFGGRGGQGGGIGVAPGRGEGGEAGGGREGGLPPWPPSPAASPVPRMQLMLSRFTPEFLSFRVPSNATFPAAPSDTSTPQRTPRAAPMGETLFEEQGAGPHTFHTGRDSGAGDSNDGPIAPLRGNAQSQRDSNQGASADLNSISEPHQGAGMCGSPPASPHRRHHHTSSTHPPHRSSHSRPHPHPHSSHPTPPNSTEQRHVPTPLLLPALMGRQKATAFVSRSKDVALLAINEVLSPPILSTLVGIIVGCIAPLQKVFFAPQAPLSLFTDIVRMLSACAIPTIIVGLGATLANGPGTARVPLRTIVSVSVCRLLILPLLGMSVVFGGYASGAYHAPDAVFILVMLLQNTAPTAILVHTMSAVHQNYDAEVSTLLFWQYVISIVTAPPYIALFLYTLGTTFHADAPGPV